MHLLEMGSDSSIPLAQTSHFQPWSLWSTMLWTCPCSCTKPWFAHQPEVILQRGRHTPREVTGAAPRYERRVVVGGTGLGRSCPQTCYHQVAGDEGAPHVAMLGWAKGNPFGVSWKTMNTEDFCLYNMRSRASSPVPSESVSAISCRDGMQGWRDHFCSATSSSAKAKSCSDGLNHIIHFVPYIPLATGNLPSGTGVRSLPPLPPRPHSQTNHPWPPFPLQSY